MRFTSFTGPEKALQNTGKTPKLPNRPVFAHLQFFSDSKIHQKVSWWTFQPQKKIFCPPPPIPRKHPPGPSPPPPSPARETPPLLGFSIKSRARPPPGASDSPFPSPEQKKMKISKNTPEGLGGIDQSPA